jgi:hypothetical protein
MIDPWGEYDEILEELLEMKKQIETMIYKLNVVKSNLYRNLD